MSTYSWTQTNLRFHCFVCKYCILAWSWEIERTMKYLFVTNESHKYNNVYPHWNFMNTKYQADPPVGHKARTLLARYFAYLLSLTVWRLFRNSNIIYQQFHVQFTLRRYHFSNLVFIVPFCISHRIITFHHQAQHFYFQYCYMFRPLPMANIRFLYFI